MGCTESLDHADKTDKFRAPRIPTVYHGKWVTENKVTIKITDKDVLTKPWGGVVYSLRGHIESVEENSVLFALTEFIGSQKFINGNQFRRTDDPDKMVWYSSGDIYDFFYDIDKIIPQIVNGIHTRFELSKQ
jgi:hypothetical protein